MMKNNSARAITEMVRSQNCSTEGEALTIVARQIGLSYWAVYRIMKGKVKTITTEAEARIRRAEIRYAETEIKRLTSRIDQLQRIIGDDDKAPGVGSVVSVSCRLADLLDQAEKLGEEVRCLKAQANTISAKRSR